MIINKYCFIILVVLSSTLSIATTLLRTPTTYICRIHGKAVYTTIKQNSTCKPSTINGIATIQEEQFAPPPEVSSNVALSTEAASAPKMDESTHDVIAQIWDNYEYGSYDRTPILPPAPHTTKITQERINSSNKTNHNTAKINLSIQHSNFQIPYKPSTAVVLSRRQVLTQEIDREQAALKAAHAQLDNAKKRNDIANIYRLSNIIRDREQNVQSLQRELIR